MKTITVTYTTMSSAQLPEGMDHIAFLLTEDPEIRQTIHEKLGAACNAVLIAEIERLRDIVL